MKLTDRIIKGLFGSKSDRDLKMIKPMVEAILIEEKKLSALSDDELKNKTQDFKNRIKQETQSLREQLKEQEKQKEALDVKTLLSEKESINKEIAQLQDDINAKEQDVLNELLPEAYAVLKETCRRFCGKSWQVMGQDMVWNMVPYDVQLIGAIVLHEGKIAEMKTGEGKTLVAIFPTYLNALTGRGVHVITVNNYLAQRDAQWNAPIFEFHGLTVDCIDRHDPHSPERIKAYHADITYGTNNEYGFDYLRDNMASQKSAIMQRKHYYAIVDEVDSILIDEARTPLIISGPVVGDSQIQKYQEMVPRIERLVNAQKTYVTQLIKEAQQALDSEQENTAGLALLRVQRGLPKQRQFQKMMQDTAIQKLVQRTEYAYLQDNAKRMPEVDEALFFVVDEKSRSIEMTDKGRTLIITANEDEHFFTLPDMGMLNAQIKEKLIQEKEKELTKLDTDSALSDDYKKNEKTKITERFAKEEQQKLNQLEQEYTIKTDRIHTVNQLLKAYTLFEKEVEYIVQDGKVNIVDEHTGRVLSGRRYSDGLHQALEAKERVKVEAATQTYATITIQNYFRLYQKLSGMTGTAATEEAEFGEIYKLDVVVIPTHKPIIRQDNQDLMYRTKKEKYRAIIDQVKTYHEKGQPVLLGTVSVEVSELLSRMLKRAKIKHNVLNAKQNQRESEIVAEAGHTKAVTVATNMAGRGTDIKLTDEVIKLGGLAIIGSERHESRRIDLQLRGRSGRQGDPGESQFFVCLEDNLMKLFGSERIINVMNRLKFEEGEVIQHPMITNSMIRAQKKVEQNNFSIRKRQLEYDDVLNNQRKVIYAMRSRALNEEKMQDDLYGMMGETIHDILEEYDQNDAEIQQSLFRVLAVTIEDTEFQNYRGQNTTDIHQSLSDLVIDTYQKKQAQRAHIIYELTKSLIENQPENAIEYLTIPFQDGKRILPITVSLKKLIESKGMEVMYGLERAIILINIDEKWMEHLRNLDAVKEGIGLRAFAQKDPLLEYKKEAFTMFQQLMSDIDHQILSSICHAIPHQSAQKSDSHQQAAQTIDPSKTTSEHSSAMNMGLKMNQNKAMLQSNRESSSKTPTTIRSQKTFSRNDIVTIINTNTQEKRKIKYKKAQELIKHPEWNLIQR